MEYRNHLQAGGEKLEFVRTIEDFISSWPTISEFAKDVGIGDVAARKMKDRNRIDQTHWAAVIAAAKGARPSNLARHTYANERAARTAAKKSARNEGAPLRSSLASRE
jgi:hypothetical protein